MSLDEAFHTLRAGRIHVPRPRRLPSEIEVDQAEQKLGVRFHADFRRYLIEASDIVYGTIEPVTITDPKSHTNLFEVSKTAWEGFGVPKDLLPICDDNSDFYCMKSTGEVVFWSHDGKAPEKWPNLASWIEEVWIVS